MWRAIFSKKRDFVDVIEARSPRRVKISEPSDLSILAVLFVICKVINKTF